MKKLRGSEIQDMIHGSSKVHVRGYAGTSYSPVGGRRMWSYIVGWSGLSKRKKRTAGLRASLRKVLRITIKFATDNKETSLVLRAHSLVPPHSLS